jgi:DNA-binding transcriptional MerR regulator
MEKLESIQLEDMKDILTEAEVLEILGVNKSTLTGYRQQGLPFCRLSRTHRIYLVKDVLDFIVDKRMKV